MNMWKKRTTFLFSLCLCFVVSFAMLPNNAKADQILLLDLKYTTDATTTREIQFYGNEINPSINSVDDRFSLTVDGQSIRLPEQLYRRLNQLRRSFSHDSPSGGIEQPSYAGPLCMMGGPPVGLTLEARYLTYQTPEYSIVNHEMQPVFSMGENCLFVDLYKPVNSDAQADARAVIEILNTLSLLYD